MADTISIKVSIATKQQLEAMKIHPRETLDDIIRRVAKLDAPVPA